MAQINLLKQKSTGSSLVEVLPTYLVWLFSVVLAGVLAYYGWLFYKMHSVSADISKTQDSITQTRNAIGQLKNTEELIARQQQLKALETLMDSHVYWSQLLPEIAKVTLKTASYSDLKMSSDGTVSLAVSVPTFEDFDKFLQVFDLPEVYANFNNVRVSSFNKIEGDNSTSIKFDVNMNFNQALLKYKSASQTEQ